MANTNLRSNHLLPLVQEAKPQQMTATERLQKTKEIKKLAAFLMLSVSRAIENSDFAAAKQTLIFIADKCQQVKEQDDQIRYLKEICCRNLAKIHGKLNGEDKKEITEQTIRCDKKGMEGVYVFKYNKFSGEFECEEEQKKYISQNVLLKLVKLNAILVNQQNTENNHSMIAMLKTYGHALIIIFILTFITFSGLLFQQHSSETQIFNSLDIIFTIFSLSILIPMFLIFFKKPLRKNKIFFEKKLGQEIQKINKKCVRLKENIKFKIPQGIQFNVIVQVNSNNKNYLQQTENERSPTHLLNG